MQSYKRIRKDFMYSYRLTEVVFKNVRTCSHDKKKNIHKIMYMVENSPERKCKELVLRVASGDKIGELGGGRKESFWFLFTIVAFEFHTTCKYYQFKEIQN